MNREAKTAIKDLVQLRQILADHFNEDELRDLCFELGVDYESLPGEGKASKARELVTHLERRDRIPELLEIGRRLRPKVAWAQAYLDDRMLDLRTRRDQADQARREMRERQRVVNLRPLDVTHTFKDRVREIQELCEHLAQGGVRLVSVVGRGGMGKTALVSRVLADLERGILPVPGEDEDRELAVDGILYLSARSTGLSLERIYRDVGRMLGEPTASRLAARWTSGDTPLVAKVEYLLKTMQDGLYLILLNNLEDELTEEGTIAEEGLCLFVERCLTQPGGARLIATSREQVQVIPAALRSARSIPLREGLPESEAMALLRELDSQGELGLRDAPEEDLRRAVQLTGGIPRALEILAGILHEDPTTRLNELLADEQLFGEQVVEKLIAASYQRLGKSERQVMEALAVFDRPVEETAIAYLLYPWSPNLNVRMSLRYLVSGYFVSVNRVTGRYSLHPLDRNYAYHQIPDVVDEDKEPGSYNRRNLELRAADFYASIRKPESEWQIINDLEPQLAEFEHRIRARDYDNACLVLNSIDSDYLFKWGHYARLVEMREKLFEHLRDPMLQEGTLGSLGNAFRILGQVEQSLGFFEDALHIARERGDRRNEGIWFGYLGRACRNLGEFGKALELQEKALAIAREIGDRRNEGVWLGDLGRVYRALGQVEQAIRFYEDALAVARELGDRQQQGIHLGHLGTAYRILGRIEEAIESYEGALTIAREFDDHRMAGMRLGSLGRVYHDLGNVERAFGSYEEALASSREIGDSRKEGVWLDNLGLAYQYLGQFQRAIKFHEDALVIARETRHRRGESYRLLGLGKALLAIGKLPEATRCFMDAYDLNVPQNSGQVALALGIAHLHQQKPASGGVFANAVARCRAMLDRTPGLYEPRYALAAALVGQAICDPRWAEESERTELLAPVLDEYQQALENCSAVGVVNDMLRDLELIRTAGIESLEPVFELLEGALAQAKRDDET